jgi:hypothetical protein
LSTCIGDEKIELSQLTRFERKLERDSVAELSSNSPINQMN